MKRILWAVILGMLVLSVRADAQTVTVPRGATFAVEWTSEYPNDFARYRFFTFIDNVQTKAWTQAELTTTAAPLSDCFGATTPPTGATCFLYRGVHTSLNNTGNRVLKVRVTEQSTLLNSAFSPEVTFQVAGPPNAPSNPRVVVIVTQAGVTFEFKSAPVTVATTEANQEAMTTVKVPPIR